MYSIYMYVCMYMAWHFSCPIKAGVLYSYIITRVSACLHAFRLLCTLLWLMVAAKEEVAIFVVQETINFIRLFANRICPYTHTNTQLHNILCVVEYCNMYTHIALSSCAHVSVKLN